MLPYQKHKWVLYIALKVVLKLKVVVKLKIVQITILRV